MRFASTVLTEMNSAVATSGFALGSQQRNSVSGLAIHRHRRSALDQMWAMASAAAAGVQTLLIWLTRLLKPVSCHATQLAQASAS